MDDYLAFRTCGGQTQVGHAQLEPAERTRVACDRLAAWTLVGRLAQARLAQGDARVTQGHFHVAVKQSRRPGRATLGG